MNYEAPVHLVGMLEQLCNVLECTVSEGVARQRKMSDFVKLGQSISRVINIISIIQLVIKTSH